MNEMTAILLTPVYLLIGTFISFLTVLICPLLFLPTNLIPKPESTKQVYTISLLLFFIVFWPLSPLLFLYRLLQTIRQKLNGK